MATQHPEDPQINERVSTAVYATRLRERRLVRLIEAYRACGRIDDARDAAERLRRTREDKELTEHYFYADLGQA